LTTTWCVSEKGGGGRRRRPPTPGAAADGCGTVLAPAPADFFGRKTHPLSPPKHSTPNTQQVYEPFYADFGPLNLGRAFRYCELAARLLQESDRRRAAASAPAPGAAAPAAAAAAGAPPPPPPRVYHYCGSSPQLAANAAALAGIFQVMCLGRGAEAAVAALAPAGPFPPFRDASCGAPCFALTVAHVVGGIARARDAKLLDARPVAALYAPAAVAEGGAQATPEQQQRQQQMQQQMQQRQRQAASRAAAAILAGAHGPERATTTCAVVAASWHMDAAEYEHYERVENGDANWILPGKILAFSGPASRADEYPGFRAMTPEDYFRYFAARGVTSVVRLNRSAYEGARFPRGGFAHHELYFPDGSCPPAPLLDRFLALAEAEPGALAVHCKAGLGRTGVLACAYLMKHYGFRAEEALGYIRVVRPGSVIGPQQLFLGEIEGRMHAQGRAWRAAAAGASAERLRVGGSAAASPLPLFRGARVPPPLPVWGPAMAFEGLPVAARAGGSWPCEAAADEAADDAEEADLTERRAADGAAAAALVREMVAASLAAAVPASSASATITLTPSGGAQKKTGAGSGGSGGKHASPSAAANHGNSGNAIPSPRSAATAAGIGASIGNAVSSLLAGAASRAAALAAAHNGGGGGGSGSRARAAAAAATASAAPAPPASPLTSGARALGGLSSSKGGALSAGGALAGAADGWRQTSIGGASSPAAASAAGAGAGAAGAPPSSSSGFVRVLAPNGQPRKVPASMLAGAHGGVLAASIALLMGEEEGPAPGADASAPSPAASTATVAVGRPTTRATAARR